MVSFGSRCCKALIKPFYDRYEEAGKLDVVPVDEEKIAEDDRVPRVTSATWSVGRILALLMLIESLSN